jgi:hypothetical protein
MLASAIRGPVSPLPRCCKWAWRRRHRTSRPLACCCDSIVGEVYGGCRKMPARTPAGRTQQTPVSYPEKQRRGPKCWLARTGVSLLNPTAIGGLRCLRGKDCIHQTLPGSFCRRVVSSAAASTKIAGYPKVHLNLSDLSWRILFYPNYWKVLEVVTAFLLSTGPPQECMG